MDVILHLGAHRTGTTTLQAYLHQNRYNLAKFDIEYWGPQRTRNGLFSGLIKDPQYLQNEAILRGERSSGLIRVELCRLHEQGKHALIVSEENMIGSMGNNLQLGKLYPFAHERMDRFSGAFGARCKRVIISIRSYDCYWASVLAYNILHGYPMPDDAYLDRLVTQQMRWRQVIEAVASVFPKAQTVVWPFESFIGQPERQFAALLGVDLPLPMQAQDGWHNASAGTEVLRQILTDRGDHAGAAALPAEDQRWQPFARHHIEALRDQYHEDIAWLRKGADGCATYIENSGIDQAGEHLPSVHEDRGQTYDPTERIVG